VEFNSGLQHAFRSYDVSGALRTDYVTTITLHKIEILMRDKGFRDKLHLKIIGKGGTVGYYITEGMLYSRPKKEILKLAYRELSKGIDKYFFNRS
jgi:hypothetical protein